MHQLEVTSPDESATKQIAQTVAKRLKGGELIELIGDVGSGKTTFVKGLARGLGSQDEVTSPSFVLQNVYDGRLRLHHFDLYRLEEPGHIIHDIEEAIKSDDSVSVIEWAAAGKEMLPDKRIIIKFLPQNDSSRKIKISFPDAR
ncbi:MAG TPA: tRNA (adenosine(37)-N6)-threonylcarbamoyltransferase complex ATPase subunit type 1 TsaE [Candidatus Saccharimonadales bacterium]|nr:tRNA (adenosine(37)-N6)-threonylcarbamoyltransferase complex ATPase subunit type 1 TsaE [Candidatus Saccharimonadales bacterium]